MAQIRRLGPDDWQLLSEIRLAALLDAPFAFGSTHAQEVNRDANEWRSMFEGIAWFLATEDGQSVGLVGGGARSHPSRDLISMWTHSDVRGTGVAGTLVEAVISWAREEKADVLLLWVSDENPRARRFYERMGFGATGERQQLASNPLVTEQAMRMLL